MKDLVSSLENVIHNAFIKYRESFKWYVLEIIFPFKTEIFIVTKDCCSNNVKLCKREKEILDYLRNKKLI